MSMDVIPQSVALGGFLYSLLSPSAPGGTIKARAISPNYSQIPPKKFPTIPEK